VFQVCDKFLCTGGGGGGPNCSLCPGCPTGKGRPCLYRELTYKFLFYIPVDLPDKVFGVVTRVRTGRLKKGQEIPLYSKAFRLDLEPTRPPLPGHLRHFYREYSEPSTKLTTHLHTVPRLRSRECRAMAERSYYPAYRCGGLGSIQRQCMWVCCEAK
jgi:hypothetical protein